VALVLPRRADWLTAFFELLAHCLIARSAREERAEPPTSSSLAEESAARSSGHRSDTYQD
jgi:hypothetical protein